jgi:hypothetical protein
MENWIYSFFQLPKKIPNFKRFKFNMILIYRLVNDSFLTSKPKQNEKKLDE